MTSATRLLTTKADASPSANIADTSAAIASRHLRMDPSEQLFGLGERSGESMQWWRPQPLKPDDAKVIGVQLAVKSHVRGSLPARCLAGRGGLDGERVHGSGKLRRQQLVHRAMALDPAL